MATQSLPDTCSHEFHPAWGVLLSRTAKAAPLSLTFSLPGREFPAPDSQTQIPGAGKKGWQTDRQTDMAQMYVFAQALVPEPAHKSCGWLLSRSFGEATATWGGVGGFEVRDLGRVTPGLYPTCSQRQEG